MNAPADLIERLRAARHVAVLTGAGVSAESGLPTFRDPLTGLWARYRPEDLATPEAFARDPALVWGWYRMRRAAARAASPNPGHVALAELESRVPRMTLVTQNVDGLHRRAGSREPLELHGSLFRARCTAEGRVVDLSDVDPGDDLPCCPGCGALLRPDIVWFGESLPDAALGRAREAARSCDVFLSVGTSNRVYPAAALPWEAASSGATVAIINPDVAGQGSGRRIHHLVGTASQVVPELLEAAWPGAAMGLGRVAPGSYIPPPRPGSSVGRAAD
jgi:NAD-dependent deacetylase